jgi:hypothetical protein
MPQRHATTVDGGKSPLPENASSSRRQGWPANSGRKTSADESDLLSGGRNH